MRVQKLRSRIVSFRLSPEEFESLKERSISEGARSMSDFARASAFNSASGRDMLQKEIETNRMVQGLQQQIKELDREMQRLNRLMDALLTGLAGNTRMRHTNQE